MTIDCIQSEKDAPKSCFSKETADMRREGMNAITLCHTDSLVTTKCPDQGLIHCIGVDESHGVAHWGAKVLS